MKKAIWIIIIFVFASACNPPALAPTITPTVLPTATQTNSVTPTATITVSPSATNTRTVTSTSSPRATATITDTATILPTATFDFPEVNVHTQAHCRYGPSSAYLHAADLYPGDTGQVRGRYVNSKWLHVKFDKLNYWCWVSPSVIDVVGDITTVRFIEPSLQTIGSNMYGPPQNVKATRNGDEVTISWSQMSMTEDDDRGYFIEAWVCQNGAYLWWTVSFPEQYTTSYTVSDQSGCTYPSSGVVYTVEKHGYSQSATIPWP